MTRQVTALWAWVAVHADGDEKIIATEAEYQGHAWYMPLITASEATARKMEPDAQRTAASYGDGMRAELRRFDRCFPQTPL